MELTRKTRGAYFDWELTVRVVPGEDPPVAIADSDIRDALAYLRRVEQHFTDTLSLYEANLILNAQSAQSTRS
jgi:hypothetical protein